MNPALTARLPSNRPSHSPKVRHDPHGTPVSSEVSGMPSTRDNIFIRYSPESISSGAMVKPQFPPMTVVIPCSGEGDRLASQNTWAS